MARAQPRADLIVLAPDLPELRLVVEIKTRIDALDLEAATKQVQSYMQGTNCPLGLIVTPTRSWLLRDEYEADGSISRTEYPTAMLLGVSDVPAEEDELELLVGRWLESLTSGSSTGLRDEVRFDVSRYLIPALVEGRVESGRFG